MSPRLRPHARAFTLVELLVVVGIVGLLVALSLPAFRSISTGAQLASGSQALIDGLNAARQDALTLNREVEVWFYQFPDVNGGATPPSEFQAFQTFEIKDGLRVALGKPVFLPKAVLVSSSATLSPPLGNPAQPLPNGAVPLPGVAAAATTYLPLRFRADGAVDSAVGGWTVSGYVTLFRKADRTSTAPTDFITVQVDPFSGGVRAYHP